MKEFEELVIDLLYIFTSKFLNDQLVGRIKKIKVKINEKTELKIDEYNDLNDPKIEIISYFTQDHVESLQKNSRFQR